MFYACVAMGPDNNVVNVSLFDRYKCVLAMEREQKMDSLKALPLALQNREEH